MSVPLSYSSKANQIARILIQVGLLTLFWWIGSVLQQFFHAPVSGAVIGLFMVLIGLLTGIFKLEWIKTGSDFILGELVLFFIRCMVGLVKYKNLLVTEGWELVLSVVIGTICVMVITAFSVYFGFKIEEKLKNLHRTSHHIHQAGE